MACRRNSTHKHKSFPFSNITLLAKLLHLLHLMCHPSHVYWRITCIVCVRKWIICRYYKIISYNIDTFKVSYYSCCHCLQSNTRTHTHTRPYQYVGNIVFIKHIFRGEDNQNCCCFGSVWIRRGRLLLL